MIKVWSRSRVLRSPTRRPRGLGIRGLLGVTAVAVATILTTGGVPVAAGSSAGSASHRFVFYPPKVPPQYGVHIMVNTKPYQRKPPFIIGYADASLSNSWRIMAKAEVEWGISLTHGLAKLVYTNANNSTSQQIADVEDLLARHVDAIILAATNTSALCPSIAKAVAQHVPVLILERAVSCRSYTEFINDRDNDNGYLQGAWVAQRLHGHGNVVIIGGQQGNGATIDEVDNALKILHRYPGIHVLTTQYADYEPGKCKEIMQALLARYPKIDAVESISGNQGVGCYDAVKAAGRVSQIKAWTGDDANGWMKIVARTHIPSIMTPIPVDAGKYAVLQAVKILEGKPVPEDFIVPKPNITPENIAHYVKFNRPDEWWWSGGLPCKFDPYCPHK